MLGLVNQVVIESGLGQPVSCRPDGSQLFGGRAPRQHLRFKASNDFAVETAMVDAGRGLQSLVHLVGNALESQVGWHWLATVVGVDTIMVPFWNLSALKR